MEVGERRSPTFPHTLTTARQYFVSSSSVVVFSVAGENPSLALGSFTDEKYSPETRIVRIYWQVC